MSDAELRLRIGEVAELAGTTPRTIRYYEEIGPAAGRRASASRPAPHLRRRGRRAPARAAAPASELLGVSLDELQASWSRPRSARGAARASPRQRGPAPRSARSSTRRSATSTASSSSCAAAGTRSPSSRPSCVAPAAARARPPARPRRSPVDAMTAALVDGLVVRFGEVHRRRRRVLRGRARRGVRPARPQRRRQDDDPARAHHAAAARPRAARSWPATTCVASASAVRA